MLEIDDFFVTSDMNQIDLNKTIEKYKYFKDEGIPQKDLIENFSALSQNSNAKMMFKKSKISKNYLQEFWALRFLEIAENNNCVLNKEYSPLSKDDLKEIVNFCSNDERIKLVQKYLMERGIALYFIASLQGTKIDGAVFLTNNNTIAVGLTKYKRLDYLWFTLLHELSHTILHSKLLKTGIISIEDSSDKIEIEANEMATDAILCYEKYRSLLKQTMNSSDIIKYAEDNKIHPALLAGIIRRGLKNYDLYKDIIDKYEINKNDL